MKTVIEVIAHFISGVGFIALLIIGIGWGIYCLIDGLRGKR